MRFGGTALYDNGDGGAGGGTGALSGFRGSEALCACGLFNLLHAVSKPSSGYAVVGSTSFFCAILLTAAVYKVTSAGRSLSAGQPVGYS